MNYYFSLLLHIQASLSPDAYSVITGIIVSRINLFIRIFVSFLQSFQVYSSCAHPVPLHHFFKTVVCEHVFLALFIIYLEHMFVNRFNAIFRTYFLNICLRFPIYCVIIKYIKINGKKAHLRRTYIWHKVR